MITDMAVSIDIMTMMVENSLPAWSEMNKERLKESLLYITIILSTNILFIYMYVMYRNDLVLV